MYHTVLIDEFSVDVGKKTKTNMQEVSEWLKLSSSDELGRKYAMPTVTAAHVSGTIDCLCSVSQPYNNQSNTGHIWPKRWKKTPPPKKTPWITVQLFPVELI